jgi:hypothetical protein
MSTKTKFEAHDAALAAQSDAAELLGDKLYQAASLSATLYGVGRDAFNGWSAEIQDGVLWLLHDTICEAWRLHTGRSFAKNAGGAE